MIFMDSGSNELIIINWENSFGGHVVMDNRHGFVSLDVLDTIKKSCEFIGFI